MARGTTKFIGDVEVTGTLTAGTTIDNGAIDETVTIATDKKLQLRDDGIYINSGADGKITISADGTGADDITLDGAVTINDVVTAAKGVQSAAVARTATADGTGTGTIAAGTSAVVVTCDDANKIIKLPAPVVGNVIRLINGATGYELRSSDPATIAINGGSGANAESAIPASTLVTCTCTSATTWIAMNQGSNGALAATEVAA